MFKVEIDGVVVWECSTWKKCKSRAKKMRRQRSRTTVAVNERKGIRATYEFV